MKGVKLTKRAVDAAKPGAKDRFIWDSELPGFGLKVTPSGSRVYVFQYTKGKRKRRVTIGGHGADWTPKQARDEARSLRGEVARGGDPAEGRASNRRALSVVGFSERYLKEHAATKKKPTSVREDRRLLTSVVNPRLGNQLLKDISRADIARLHHALRKTPTQANRVLALLSKMMNLAEQWGMRPDGSNPCRSVEKYKENSRKRFLSDEEFKRLGTTLAAAERDGKEPASAIAAIWMLAFSGCRVSEVLSLRWDQVDLGNGCLSLTESKTGARAVVLGDPAVQLLDGLAQVDGNPYVFPGRRKGEHLVGLGHVWERLRSTARLEDVRLHDIRHSYASVGAGAGVSLHVIGGLLGHQQPSTTHRYAHLSNDPRRAAANRIASAINSVMTATQSAEVLEFPAPVERADRNPAAIGSSDA